MYKNAFIAFDAINESNLKKCEKKLLLFFYNKADTHNNCESFYLVENICKKTGICRASYKNAIKSLISLGLVKRDFRYNKITGKQRSNMVSVNADIFNHRTEASIMSFINDLIEKYQNKQFKKQLKELNNSKNTDKIASKTLSNGLKVTADKIREFVLSNTKKLANFTRAKFVSFNKKAKFRKNATHSNTTIQKIFYGMGLKNSHIKYTYFLEKEKRE